MATLAKFLFYTLFRPSRKATRNKVSVLHPLPVPTKTCLPVCRCAAGFLPIISMAGATLEHCEVASSNNGWIIEVVNPATDVTLWLDPENPTGLLRWGSVLCQALAKSVEDSAECME